MCVDFTDLNKACSLDAYPLPSIELMGLLGANFLASWMHAYSRYNHIKMHSMDEEKTTFIIESVNYCYKIMLFGL